MKIFLAAPFGQYVNPNNNQLMQSKIDEFREIIELLENKGHIVGNAHKRENWGNSWMPPEICTPLDYQAIIESDLIVAFPGHPASGGVHIELGWASAHKKQIYLLLEEDRVYSNLVDGLGTLDCTVNIIRYTDHYHLLEQLREKI